MDHHSHSHLIHIRSKDCTSLTTGFNTHLQIELAEALELKLNHKFHISISSAEIPYVFYAVSSYLKSNEIEVDGNTSLVITDGNYDIYDLITVINSDATFPFSATFDHNTCKVTLTNTSVATKILNFDSENSRELAKMLGFDRVPTSVPAITNNVVASQGVVNLRPVHSMFLHSDLAATNVIVTREGSVQASIENILDKIPLGEVGPSQIITYDPYESAPFSTVLDVDAIRVFEISLRDQNARLIQLNETRYESTQQPQAVNVEKPHNTTLTNTVKSTDTPVLPRNPIPMPLNMPRVTNTVKRPRIDEDHLKKQEIDLQNALLYAASMGD